MARYIVGTEDNQFYVDPYGNDEPCVFTSKEAAQELACSMPGGFMPGPGGTLIKVNPWKVYELVEGENMREAEKAKADAANKARIEKVGVDLMNAFNRGKKDPSDMATLGHDTMTGYEFYIERDGMVIRVELTRDRD